MKVPFDDELLTDLAGGTGNGCGLQEGQFPRLGQCYDKSYSLFGQVLRPTCPYCTIWTFPPEGTNLVMAHLLGCALRGYEKRVKDQDVGTV